MVRKLKERKSNVSYGFIGSHKVKPQGCCWNCGAYNGNEKELVFIINDSIPRADCACPSCSALMGIYYPRYQEFVHKIRSIPRDQVLKAIRKDQQIRGILAH